MDRQQMIDEIKNNIGSYIQHGGAIEGGGWKVYDPISLARVLSALGHGYWYDFSNQMIMFMKDSFIDGIYWYLLKEDKSDAYLDDQSDDTIEALHKLLVR